MGLVRLDTSRGSADVVRCLVANDSGSSLPSAAVAMAASGVAALAGCHVRGLNPLGSPSFVPLREGPALKSGAPRPPLPNSLGTTRKCGESFPHTCLVKVGNGAAISAGGGSSSSAECTAERVACSGPGVDVLSVKRKLAPFAAARQRGAIAVAMESAGLGAASSAVEKLSA